MDNLLLLFRKCLDCKYIHVENDGSFAVETDGRHLYIFFEKSNGLDDWDNNFDFPAVPYRDMAETWYCHRGFLRVWKSVEPYLADYIKNPGIRRITVVGYSHGAALAAFCHEYIWFNRPDLRGNFSGYGFGCPRILWGFIIKPEIHARWMDFTPVRNIDDIVTHLPPKLLGYRHVNRIMKIGEPGKYSRTDAHRSESYIAELEKLNNITGTVN
jgi:hypothetical protein